MTFQHELGTTKSPGCIPREGLHEGFVEIFAQSETNCILDVDEDITPPELEESYVEGTTDNESSSVTIALYFFDTQ
jgi:hypothetical protein